MTVYRSNQYNMKKQNSYFANYISRYEENTPGHRISENAVYEKNAGIRVFIMISPVIIYMLYVTLLTGIGSYVLNSISEGSEECARYISANKTVINAYIRIAVMIIAILAQIPALKGEHPVLFRGTARDGSVVAVRRCIYCVILGMSAAIALNILMGLSGLTDSSDSYVEVAKRQFELPMMLGIFLYGLISPLAEEVVFRGLVYNRMRRCRVGLILSMVLSSRFFGIYHFNVVQGIYGTLMGLMIVWIYESFGAFLYPYMVHAAANMAIYVISSTADGIQRIMTPVMLIISGAIVILTIYRIVSDDKDHRS